MPRTYTACAASGITADHLQAVILVKASRLQKMMIHIQQKYGSVEQYLQQQAGLDEEIMKQLRSQLLTEVTTG
ncbi:MAG: tyrosine-protein phosphatase [Anaerolineae bacterium]|nr:tyrosine-protein phosphatase [Anaerolineae bacterium]